MLTPVRQPDGLRAGRDRRRPATSGGSSRSRSPTRSPANTINAGIYVLEPETFDRIPKDTPGRSSAATSRRSSSAARRSSPTRTTATGSTSARPRSTRRSTATSWTAGTRRRRLRASRRRTCSSRRRRARRRRRGRRGPCVPRRRRGRARPARRRRRTRCSARQCHIEEQARSSRHRSSGPNARSAAKPSSTDAILGRHCHVGRGAVDRRRARARRQVRRHRLQPV